MNPGLIVKIEIPQELQNYCCINEGHQDINKRKFMEIPYINDTKNITQYF